MANENQQTERINITIPQWENDLLDKLSDSNPKSECNKSNNFRSLYRYGFIFLIKQFSIKNAEDFKKNIKIIHLHNDLTFEPIIKNFYNSIKAKGRVRDEKINNN